MSDDHHVAPRSVPAGPSACARAATTKEAAYRLDYPLAAARNTRVIALDDLAAEIVRIAAGRRWEQAQFYTVAESKMTLDQIDGGAAPLSSVLEDSNTVIMVSVTGEGGAAIATIGSECRARGIMTAGLIVAPDAGISDALHHLRPYARILLVPAEPDDLVELLTATRA